MGTAEKGKDTCCIIGVAEWYTVCAGEDDFTSKKVRRPCPQEGELITVGACIKARKFLTEVIDLDLSM